MTAGTLIEAPWQIERNGLLTGDLTAFDIRQIIGLASSAEVRSQDRTLVTRNGAVPGSDYLNPRSLVMVYEIVEDSADTLSSRLAEFNLAFGPGREEEPLVFQVPGVAGGVKARVNARVRRRNVPIDMEFNHGVARVTLDLIATDPLLYSNELHTSSTSLSGTGGGMTFDVTPDITFGTVSSGGGLSVTNAGNYATSPVFRIDGPCENPVIESLTADRSLSFDITLGESQFLVVDVAKRTILLGGTASRYSAMQTGSRWFDLEPGSNSLEFRASTSTNAVLEVSHRDAWS